MKEADRDNRLHQLALHAKHGDQYALETLLADPELKNVIYNIITKIVEQKDADDLYQEVCLYIALHLRTWQEKSKFTTWISSMTINRCLNFRNKTEQDKKREREWSRIHAEGRQIPQQLRYILVRERHALIRQALEEMGEPCKRIMTLYLYHGLDKKEIMDVLNIKKSAFHQRWRKCYIRLQQKIQQIISKHQYK